MSSYVTSCVSKNISLDFNASAVTYYNSNVFVGGGAGNNGACYYFGPNNWQYHGSSNEVLSTAYLELVGGSSAVGSGRYRIGLVSSSWTGNQNFTSAKNAMVGRTDSPHYWDFDFDSDKSYSVDVTDLVETLLANPTAYSGFFVTKYIAVNGEPGIASAYNRLSPSAELTINYVPAPPEAPVGVITTAVSNSYFNSEISYLYWGGVYVSSLSVHYKVNNGSWIDITSTKDSSSTPSGGGGTFTAVAAAGNTVVVRFLAYNSIGTTDSYTTTALTKVANPVAPSSVGWSSTFIKPTDSVTLTFSGQSSQVSYVTRGEIYNASTNALVSNTVISSGAVFNSGIFTFTRGASYYAKVRITDGFGNTAVSASSGTFKVNSLPTSPALTIGTDLGYTKKDVVLTWTPGTDVDAGTVTTEILRTVGTGAETLLTSVTTGSYTDNISAQPGGTVVKYRLRSKDATGEINPTYSPYVTVIRNYAPVVSSLVATSGTDGNGEVESSASITLSGTDQGGGSITYLLESSTDNVNFTQISSNTSGVFTVTLSDYVSRGATLYLRGRLYDSMEYSSYSSTLSLKYNNLPVIESVSWPLTNPFTGSSAVVSYSGVSDTNLRHVSFQIYADDTIVATKDVTSSGQTVDLSMVPEGTMAKIGAYSVDYFWKTSNTVFTTAGLRLGPPVLPTIYPANGTVVFSSRPVFRIVAGTTYSPLYIAITVGGTTYDSNTSPAFSVQSVTTGQVIKFTPPVDVVGQAITIKAYYTEWLFVTTTVSYTRQPMSAPVSGDLVQPYLASFIGAVNTMHIGYTGNIAFPAIGSGVLIDDERFIAGQALLNALSTALYGENKFTADFTGPSGFIEAADFASIVTVLNSFF